MAMILLAGAALLLTSFLSLLAVPAGFRVDGVLTLRLSLPDSRYDHVQRASFFRDLLPRLRSLPGVIAVGAVSFLPFQNDDWRTGIEIEGPVSESDEPTRAHLRFATPGYFETLSVPLLAGRELNGRDESESTPVVMVNETFARRYWGNENAVGRRVRLVGDDEPWRLVAGVVGDVKYWGLDRETNPEIFLPHAQFPFRSMAVVLRPSIDGETLFAEVRSEVQRLDRNLPLSDVTSLRNLLDESVSSSRFNAVLLTSFALTALLLVCIGVYSVMAYAVAQRAREIGVRIALGAERLSITRMVVREGLALVVLGVAVGLLGAVGLSQFLQGLLFQISPTDPGVLATVAGVIAFTGLLACYVPARRATRINPIVALRHD